MSLRIATRGSALALVQSRTVAELLGGAEMVEAPGTGEPGDKARFVRGVERALLEERAEVGVHSAKDLPGRMTAGLEIAAVPAREDARDAWLGPGGSIEELPEGATVGTSSLRRRSQLLAARPDLRPVELRGNVDTRIRKLRDGEVDGIVLALAGLRRLGLEDEASFAFGPEAMTPAAGQGCLVVQARAGDPAAAAARSLTDAASASELMAERAAVVGLGADCSSPVGIHARRQGSRMTVDGFAGLPDGSEWVRDSVEGDAARPEALGRELAGRMAAAGAAGILRRQSEGRAGP